MGICINLILLIVGTMSDIRSKTISIWLPIIGIVASILLMFSSKDIKSQVWGILFGLLMISVAFISNSRFGLGDGMMILVNGALNGIFFVIESLFIALILASVVGIILILFIKMNREYRLPFIPFLLIGTIIVSVSEVIC